MDGIHGRIMRLIDRNIYLPLVWTLS